jgi:uncharacterized protein
MKRVLFILTVILLLVSMLPSLALAAGQKIFDYAELFSPDELAQLQTIVDTHTANYGSDLGIVTITDNGGKSPQAYADDFYDQNGFGNDGMLLLIDMESRELYISTKGSMIDILNDDRINDLLDLMYTYVSDKAYFAAMQRTIEKAETYMESGPVSGQYREEVQPRSLTPGWIVISILIGAGIGGLVVLIIYKQYKKAYKPVPYDYRKEANLSLNTTLDNLIDTHTTSRYIPPDNDSFGSSGGRSSTHSSSSGSSHGGGGRSF